MGWKWCTSQINARRSNYMALHVLFVCNFCYCCFPVIHHRWIVLTIAFIEAQIWKHSWSRGGILCRQKQFICHDWDTPRRPFRPKRGSCSRDRISSSNEELSPLSSSTITDESPSNQGPIQPSKSSVPWFPGFSLANIRCLRYKMDEVQAVVDIINLPGIVCLVETWLNPSICDSIISLSDRVLLL